MIYFANGCRFRLFIVAATVALTSACSSSDSPNSDVADGVDTTTGGDHTDGETPTPNPSTGRDNIGATSGDFDLPEFLFHGNVLVKGGEIDFDEKIFGKNDSEDGSFITLKRSIVNNNGTIEEYSSDTRIKTFTIGEHVTDPKVCTVMT